MSVKSAGNMLNILREKYSNTTVSGLSTLFVFVTLCNMFVMYRVLLDIIPFPIGVTFSQLLVGMMLAYVLGGFDINKVKEEIFERINEYSGPVGTYLVMFTIANILLKSTPIIAVYPSILALAVVFHHIFRYLFCDQRNLLSAKTIMVTTMSYVVICFDTNIVPPTLLGLSIIYAISSAVFRAICLEKALHVTDRDANKLYNVQVFCGVIVLFFATLLFEPNFFFTALNRSFIDNLLIIGCLVTVGTIPFIKNVIANKLVTIGQQAPWRFSEIVSVLLFFAFGSLFFENKISPLTLISFGLVVAGRTLSMVDIVGNEKNKKRPVKKESNPISFNDLHDDTHDTAMEEIQQEMSSQAEDQELSDDHASVDQEIGYVQHSDELEE